MSSLEQDQAYTLSNGVLEIATLFFQQYGSPPTLCNLFWYMFLQIYSNIF